MTEFSELGLSPQILQAVADSGYTTATPIQADAIPIALTGADVLADPRFEAPEHQNFRMLVQVFSSLGGGGDLPMAIELEDVGPGYRLGAAIKPVSGEAAGRALYCASHADNVYYCDGEGEANLLRFQGVKAGDEVLFTSYAGEQFKLGERELLLMREDDILAVIG